MFLIITASIIIAIKTFLLSFNIWKEGNKLASLFIAFLALSILILPIMKYLYNL